MFGATRQILADETDDFGGYNAQPNAHDSFDWVMSEVATSKVADPTAKELIKQVLSSPARSDRQSVLHHNHRSNFYGNLQPYHAGSFEMYRVATESHYMGGEWFSSRPVELPQYIVDLTEYHALATQHSSDPVMFGKSMGQLEVANQTKSDVEFILDAPSLPITREFVPSIILLRLFVEGRNVYLAEEGRDEIPLETAVSDSELSKELGRAIHKVVANYGKIKSYDHSKVRLTVAGHMSKFVQSLFGDHLSIPPTETVDFCRELTLRMSEQLSNNFEISGRWGELVVGEDGDLIYNLHRRKRRTLTQVLKG